MDSHVEFVAGWDVDILQQWRATKNEHAVLTTYMTDLQGSIDPRTNRSLRRSPRRIHTHAAPPVGWP